MAGVGVWIVMLTFADVLCSAGCSPDEYRNELIENKESLERQWAEIVMDAEIYGIGGFPVSFMDAIGQTFILPDTENKFMVLGSKTVSLHSVGLETQYICFDFTCLVRAIAPHIDIEESIEESTEESIEESTEETLLEIIAILEEMMAIIDNGTVIE